LADSGCGLHINAASTMLRACAEFMEFEQVGGDNRCARKIGLATN
jgi:hypothetical protein